MAKIEPKAKTFVELKGQRLASNRNKIDEKNLAFEDRYKRFNATIDKPHVYSEFYKGD